MRTLLVAAQLVIAALPGSVAWAGMPVDIRIPGEHVYPESLTSSGDGTVYIGSVVMGAIFRAPPGADAASVWIAPGTDGLRNIFGVYADDRSNTLWVCSNILDPAKHAQPSHGELHALNLLTGISKGRYPFPSGDAFCNDIAVSRDGTVYATDSNGMQVVRLAPGGSKLDVWSSGSFGEQGGLLDGIAVIGDSVVVNTYNTGGVFRIPVTGDGAAGPAVEVALSRPVDHPDAMRAFGRGGALLIEGGGPGTLSKIVFTGAKGEVSIVKQGYPDGPVGVTLVGSLAYVVESQFKALLAGPDAKTKPFHASAVQVGRP